MISEVKEIEKINKNLKKLKSKKKKIIKKKNLFNENIFKLRHKFISILIKIDNDHTYNYFKSMSFKNIDRYLSNFLYKLICIKRIQKCFRNYIKNKNFNLIQENIKLQNQIIYLISN